MVAGLKFLSKKSFHPKNKVNQERVKQEEEEERSKSKKALERKRRLQQERDEEELAIARGDTLKLNFMYKPPPGMETAQGPQVGEPLQSSECDSGSGTNHAEPTSPLGDITARRPGDDDAAAAFRAMLKTSQVLLTHVDGYESDHKQSASSELQPSPFDFALRGVTQQDNYEDRPKPTTEGLSELEKAVGRRNRGTSGITYEEQIQRFPTLAHAPKARGTNAEATVKFKPLGATIRNIRCLKCGQWGHQRGDRECRESGWDPFATIARTKSVSTDAVKSHKNKGHNDSNLKKHSRKVYNSSEDESDSSSSRHRKKKYERKSKSSKKSKHRRKEDDYRDRKRRRRSKSPDSRSQKHRSRSHSS